MIAPKIISTDLIGPNRWALLKALVYTDTDPEKTITAEVGFYTDFISRPWWSGFFISRAGLAAAAAVMHDAIYSGKAVYSDEMRRKYPSGMKRKDADKLLLSEALALGETKTRCYLIYVGARIGGWKKWNSYRNV